MKNKISTLTIFAAIFFSLHACSTPEERAVVVGGTDSSSAQISTSTDSLGTTSGTMENKNDSSGTNNTGDSTVSNKKMESFRHTPIDTITSLDTSRQ